MQKNILALLLLIALVVGSRSTQAQTNAVPDAVELAVLKNVYDSLGGTGWTSQTNWPTTWPATATSAQFGTWKGITVSQGDIIAITLSGNNLTGQLPNSLKALSKLRNLYLQNNSITGAIPVSLATLTTLNNIFLDHNSLTGTIPPQLGNLTALVQLRLHNNAFTGTIPASLGNVLTLTQLNLSYNQLTGTIPGTLNQLTAMAYLYVGHNQLTGTLPSLSALVNLVSFSAFGNQLTGPLPSFANQKELVTFDINDNQFTGAFPNVSQWTKVTAINVSNNLLSGPLPAGLSNCQALTTLSASNNIFTSVPPGVLTLPVIATLDVNTNSIDTLPDLSTQVNKANLTVKVQKNRLDFGQLEMIYNKGIKSLTYSPQNILDELIFVRTTPSGALTLPARAAGVNGTITWERKVDGSTTFVTINSLNSDATQKTFQRSNNQFADAGEYRYKLTNTTFAGLTIQSASIETRVGQDVVWTALASVQNTSGTLTKTAAAAGGGWNNAGARARNILNGNTDGWFEFVIDARSSTARYMLGYAAITDNYAATALDYGIEISSENGLKAVAHEGSTSIDLGAVVTGDVIRIGRVGSLMKYYKNGTALRSVTTTASNYLTTKALVNQGTTPLVLTAYSALAETGDIPDALELSILKMFYDSLGGSGWKTKTGWPAAGSWPATATATQMDAWYGIIVTGGDITGITLSSNKLTGKLPSTLGNLNALTTMDVRTNAITGSIPVSVTTLTRLTSLLLSDNKLTGSLPATLGNLVNLTKLQLSTNNFTGTVPASIGNLTKLTYLSLYTNANLTGALPTPFYNLVNLTDLYIFDTGISGTLSESIGNFTKLKNFWGYGNQWSGTLPATLGNITTLEALYLYHNQFTGTLPENWKNLTKLTNLWVHENQLTGTLPDWLGDLTLLKVLALGESQLSGVIPSTFSKLVNLTGLYLEHSNVSGTLPTALQSLNKLTIIDLKFTNLEGAIPAWLASKPTLKEFRLNNSKFTSFPDISARTDKASLIIYIQNNQVPVSDIERYFTAPGVQPFSTFTYDSQRYVKPDSIQQIPATNPLTMQAPEGGIHGVYTWERFVNGAWTNITALNQSTQPRVFTIPHADETWAGTYRFRVTNTWMTDFSIVGDPLEITVLDAINTTLTQGLYNGLITATRWRTDKAYGVTGEAFSGMYVYRYDEKYQIREARWATVNNTLNTYSFADNKYRLTGMDYDPNGNILALKRYNENGQRTHNFVYHYGANTNQLTDVDGYTTAANPNQQGFTYNALGQLTDEYKADGDNQFVEYDVTGKVTFVYQDEHRTKIKIENIYDDRGYRLAKKLYNLNGTTVDRTTLYVRDPFGNILSIYEEDNTKPHQDGADVLTLTEVPLYGSGKLGTYYPQQDASAVYEITDHLGNVRALLRDNINVYTATLEDNGQENIKNPRVQELAYFQNLSSTAVTDVHMNHTAPIPGVVDAPNKAAYLNWISGMAGNDAAAKSVGPAMMLRVNAGDTVKLEAWVKYEKKETYVNNLDLLLLSQFLGGTFASLGGFDGYTLPGVNQIIDNALTAGGFMSDGSDENRPFAYLNYIVFDANRNYVTSNFKRVPEAAGYATEDLNLPESKPVHIEIDQPLTIQNTGYVYIWVNNESENTRVWFDDVTVTQTQALVTQATDYGVWGDVLREQKSDESTYRFGYQGQFSEKDLETGWNHFELREYDPIIGRWTSKDPAGQYWSPYVGMGNDPVSGMDPDGAYSWFGAWLRNGFSSEGLIHDKVNKDWGYTTSGVENGTVWVGGNFGSKGTYWEETHEKPVNVFAKGDYSFNKGVEARGGYKPGSEDGKFTYFSHGAIMYAHDAKDMINIFNAKDFDQVMSMNNDRWDAMKDKEGSSLTIFSCKSAILDPNQNCVSLAQDVSYAHPNLVVIGVDGYTRYSTKAPYGISGIEKKVGSGKNDGYLVFYKNGDEIYRRHY